VHFLVCIPNVFLSVHIFAHFSPVVVVVAAAASAENLYAVLRHVDSESVMFYVYSMICD